LEVPTGKETKTKERERERVREKESGKKNKKTKNKMQLNREGMPFLTVFSFKGWLLRSVRLSRTTSALTSGHWEWS
jgi:hypothetical protein